MSRATAGCRWSTWAPDTRVDDDTVLLQRRRRTWPGVLVAAVLVSGAGGLAVLWRTPAPAPPAEVLRTADEAEIRDHVAIMLTVFRFKPNPAILVLDFPELSAQARMLNRVAAWVEKAGLPRDRLLTDAELDAATRKDGGTPDTFYFGHDYRASDLQRFFDLADRDKLALLPDEERLRRLVRQAGSDPAGFGALVSVPRAGASNGLTDVNRAAILRHELSHGEYFTNAAYARAVNQVWNSVLTEPERALFRAFLGTEGYDTSLDDLMANEMQAYLMHTPVGPFFDERQLGIEPVRLAVIRSAFIDAMPPSWLRDTLTAPAVPVRVAPRRRRGQGRVSSTTASAASAPPRRRRLSMAACRSRR